MNRYLIEHKIRTLAAIWSGKPFLHDGYEFQQWEFLVPSCRPAGDAWTAKKEISSLSCTDAINSFRAGLFPILDRIATISQCYTMAEAESFLVLRLNDNPEHIFFLRYSQDRKPVSLPFNAKCVEALDKLDALGDKVHALSYLHEATNASPFLTRLVMLLATLEALAGEKASANSTVRTNMEFIRDKILKNDVLYERLYKYGTGLRHAILHGKKIDLREDTCRGIDYVDEAYRAIVNYLNDELRLEIDTKVINPQRIPYANFETVDAWFKAAIDETKIDLRTFCGKFSSDQTLSYQYDQGIEGLRYANPPEDY